MRLYLSSYKFGNHPERFFELIDDKSKKIAIIANASDFYGEADIEDRVNQEIQTFYEFGYAAERLDLREYFDKADELEDRITMYGAVWVRGGNSFVLRRAFEYSGFGEIIKRMVTEDFIVYGGYSAGACVVGSTLHGIELCDEAYEVPVGYDHEVIWEGLGIVHYAIAPHYQSDHPESALIDEVVAYFFENDIEHKKLRDGEVIIIDGNTEKIL
jgi:dipeptidase E